jgi:two-component system, cell cycle sensor histidine kinase and response regulator CckA
MTKKVPRSKQPDGLRKQTGKRSRKPVDSIGETSEIEVNKLVHELEAHQIELEMQNEALQRSQMETADERHKYTDLYDFAPVGYFTLDR